MIKLFGCIVCILKVYQSLVLSSFQQMCFEVGSVTESKLKSEDVDGGR